MLDTKSAKGLNKAEAVSDQAEKPAKKTKKKSD
jgi:hypothetical protein